jgi:hypothetical protein
MLIRLHDGTRGHRVEAAGLAVPLRPLARPSSSSKTRTRRARMRQWSIAAMINPKRPEGHPVARAAL